MKTKNHNDNRKRIEKALQQVYQTYNNLIKCYTELEDIVRPRIKQSQVFYIEHSFIDGGFVVKYENEYSGNIDTISLNNLLRMIESETDVVDLNDLT